MLLTLDDVLAELRSEWGDEKTNAFIERVKAKARDRQYPTTSPRLYEIFPGEDRLFRNTT